MTNELSKIGEQELLGRLSELIECSKQQISSQANSILTMLFWQIGKDINDFVLGNERAEYGKYIMSTVSTHLTEKYGSNFEFRNLRRMRQFAEQFTDIEIVSSLSTQLDENMNPADSNVYSKYCACIVRPGRSRIVIV
jgi:hypothetical protein